MSDLERKLSGAAARVDWPDSDLAGRVVTRIEVSERQIAGRRWLQIAMAAAVIALLVLATPAGRQAVADLLEIAGIRVQWDGESEAVQGADLELGERVTLDEAAARVPFELLVPTGAVVGEPDATFHSEFPPEGAVHLVWESGPALPAAGDTGIGLLYSQFEIEPPGSFVKGVNPDIEAGRITVRGNDGFWLEGVPHIVFYQDEHGVQERARLAANVLAWEEEGVTHRIETTRGLDFALDLAESLQPIR